MSSRDSGDYVVAILSELARAPTAVPLGPQTLMEPDDPKLVRYVQHVLRPELLALGVERLREVPRNQLLAEFGDGEGPGVLVTAYTPTQHNNLMADPWSGRIRVPQEYGVEEPCLFGQGVSQNKVHQACLLDLARRLVAAGDPVRGRLWLAINNEGRSTHDCTYAILEALPARPDFVLQLFPTGFRIAVGNRGRVDIDVEIEGRAAHSSQPALGLSAIDGAVAVANRVAQINDRLHAETGGSELGPEQAVIYLLDFEPEAPHTLPGRARLVIDRRILPETDIAAAVAEVRDALASIEPWRIRVEQGVTMLPCRLATEPAPLRALEQAIERVLERPAERYFYPGTFDAGGPSARGIPAVMFGAAGEGDLLGDDYVRLSAVRAESEILREFVRAAFAE